MITGAPATVVAVLTGLAGTDVVAPVLDGSVTEVTASVDGSVSDGESTASALRDDELCSTWVLTRAAAEPATSTPVSDKAVAIRPFM